MTPTRDELLKLAKQAEARAINDVNMEMLIGDIAFDARSLERFAALLCAHQAQAEPVAVFEGYIDGEPHIKWIADSVPVGTEFYATPPSSDQTSLDEYKRRLADMCREYQALSVKVDQAWNEAIEAAEKQCEDREDYMGEHVCAIRALARPSQAQEPSKWTVTHNGKSVTGESLTKAVAAARTLRTDEEEQIAAENLMRAVSEELVQPISSATDDLPRIVAELREQAHEYRQDDRTVGMFAQPETAILFDEFADRIESLSRAQQAPAESGLTPKQAWWAGYRAGKGLPPDTPRNDAISKPAAQQAPAVSNGVPRPDYRAIAREALGLHPHWDIPQQTKEQSQ